MKKQTIVPTRNHQSVSRQSHPLLPSAAAHTPQGGLRALQNSAGNQAVSLLTTQLQKLHVDDRGATLIPPIAQEVLHSSGQPLEPAIQAWMEAQFGCEFGQVRIHTDPKAAASAEAVNANAYTVGKDIVFGANRYSPHDRAGNRLLAHELAHVQQQSRVGVSPAALPNHALETEARQAATDVSRGAAVSVTGASAPGLAKEPKQNKSAQVSTAALLRQLAAFRQVNPPEFVRFLTRNEVIIYQLLKPYGFKGSWVKDEGYLSDFDAAYAQWAQQNGESDLLPGPIIVPPEPDPDEVILGALPDGTGYVGKRRDYQRNVQFQRNQRSLRTLDNIRSGLGGTIGYALGGDEGSDLGAALGNLAGVAGATAAARNANRAVAPTTPTRPPSSVRAASPPAPRRPTPPISRSGPTPQQPRVTESAGAAPPGTKTMVDPFTQRSGQVVATAQKPQAQRTGIEASGAEFEAYNTAIHQRGEIGLQRPGNVNQGGPDFITAVRGADGKITVIVTDATINAAKVPKTTVPPKWLGEVRDAVAPNRLQLGNPKLEAEIRDAVQQGRVQIRTQDVIKTPQGTVNITDR